MQEKIPLILTYDSLLDVIKKEVNPEMLIITDDYNYPVVKVLADAVCVNDQNIEHIEQVKRDYIFQKVIAVGGCTALDFGRACAVGKKIVVIPTILSNSCLSTNRSVINRGGVYKSEVTTAPEKTIVSISNILQGSAEDIKRWSASGLGDLFSSVSASIEFEYRKSKKSFLFESVNVHNNVPLCFEVLDWILDGFTSFNGPTLEKIAQYLHLSSLDVIVKGHTHFNAASEHWLYYKMQEKKKYQKSLSTHGMLVSIGNLITSMIFAEQTGDYSFYNKFRIVHKKLGLPLSFEDLRLIGVDRDDIVNGLQDLKDQDCLYRDYFSTNDFSIIDKIFGSKQ